MATAFPADFTWGARVVITGRDETAGAATLRRETILTTDFDFLRHVLEVNLMGEVEVWKRNGKHAA